MDLDRHHLNAEPDNRMLGDPRWLTISPPSSTDDAKGQFHLWNAIIAPHWFSVR